MNQQTVDGFKLSVIGVGSPVELEHFMKELAEGNGGKYIRVN